MSASSAIAVALLGISVAPASAELPPFFVFADSDFEFLLPDIGHDSIPALGDLDGDGDLDLVAGELYGAFSYFENFGLAGNADFINGSPPANPLAGEDVGSFSSPTLGDLDGDGDLDLVSGERFGSFVYYENTGTATSPAFLQQAGGANPLDGQSAVSYSNPALGDLDGDGDLDLVAGGNGLFFYFENTGDASSPAFAAHPGAANPLDGQAIGGGTPTFGDLDADGDLDLVAGENFGTFFTFENTGSATTPAFAARTGAANPLAGHDVGGTSSPALGDLDGDGDPDLVSGEFDGRFNFFENFGDRLAKRTGAANPLAVENFGFLSTPTFGDIDGDGDLDVVTGGSTGTFAYYENTGSATLLAFVRRTGSANPLDGQDVGASSAPALGDYDGDGDLDMLSGNQAGHVHSFRNTGSAASPAFIKLAGFINGPFYNTVPALGDVDSDGDVDLVVGESGGSFRYLENVGGFFDQRFGTENPLGDETIFLGYSAPALGDLEGDGDVDLISGNNGGSFSYFENTGVPGNPAFIERSDLADPPVSPLAGQRVGSLSPFLGDRSTPALGDLDRDGDLDLVVGEWYGLFHYFESFVAQASPPVLAVTGGANPLDGEDVGSLAAPALVDLDGDGDTDLLAGEDLGTFRFFENSGSAMAPAFVARTGAANPLVGRDVGDEAKPAFADLDGDGDFDLLAGSLAGSLTYFANTGDATTPLFAGAVANPFGLSAAAGGSAAPVFGDLDADGDLDLVVGAYYDTLQFFENTGSRTSPAFALRTGIANPFASLALSYYATPALGDFDRDGDLDLALGREHGRFFYFHNQSLPSEFGNGEPVLRFMPLTGALNPLAGEDVGDLSAPAAGDLNGDGTPDLVTGALSGTFAVHYFPEPARGLLLAAGIAMLKLVGRARSRSGGLRPSA